VNTSPKNGFPQDSVFAPFLLSQKNCSRTHITWPSSTPQTTSRRLRSKLFTQDISSDHSFHNWDWYLVSPKRLYYNCHSSFDNRDARRELNITVECTGLSYSPAGVIPVNIGYSQIGRIGSFTTKSKLKWQKSISLKNNNSLRIDLSGFAAMKSCFSRKKDFSRIYSGWKGRSYVRLVGKFRFFWFALVAKIFKKCPKWNYSQRFSVGNTKLNILALTTVSKSEIRLTLSQLPFLPGSLVFFSEELSPSQSRPLAG